MFSAALLVVILPPITAAFTVEPGRRNFHNVRTLFAPPLAIVAIVGALCALAEVPSVIRHVSFTRSIASVLPRLV